MATAPPWMRPRGWFQVGWSGEIAPSEVRTVRCFGRDVVLYRDTDTEVLHALDSRCQHLGAHLGVGGTVAGDCIVCPFHGWSWGPDGRNREIPYADKPNRSRRVEVWEACERNGIVYLWHDPDGGPPQWELPDLFEILDDGDTTAPFHEPYPAGAFRYEDLTIEPRVTAENIVDPAHFMHVHGTKRMPTLVDHEITPFMFRTKLHAPSRGKAGGSVATKLDTVTLISLGVGVSFTRFAGRDNTHGVFSCTPVDACRSTLFQTVWLEQLDGETSEALAARRAAVASVYPEDLKIWASQEFLDVPGLTAEEAPLFREMRRFCRQFEPRTNEQPTTPA